MERCIATSEIDIHDFIISSFFIILLAKIPVLMANTDVETPSANPLAKQRKSISISNNFCEKRKVPVQKTPDLISSNKTNILFFLAFDNIDFTFSTPSLHI